MPTNAKIPTQIRIENKWISFQEYFVKMQCKPKVKKIEYKGISNVEANSEAIKAISGADLIILAPSNPLLSLLPIINIPQIKYSLIRNKKIPKIAVSPLISGKAIKGPANKIMEEMKLSVHPKGISDFYKEFIDILIIDNKDMKDCNNSNNGNIKFIPTETLMKTKKDKINLAKFIIDQAKIFMSN